MKTNTIYRTMKPLTETQTKQLKKLFDESSVKMSHLFDSAFRTSKVIDWPTFLRLAHQIAEVLQGERWVSLKDKPSDGRCLLLTTSKMVVIGDLYRDIWRVDGAIRWAGEENPKKLQSDYEYTDITHWMPLPDTEEPIINYLADKDINDKGEAITLLRDLADLQNGPPLETVRKEWENTMHNVYAFLNENEPEPTHLEIPEDNLFDLFPEEQCGLSQPNSNKAIAFVPEDKLREYVYTINDAEGDFIRVFKSESDAAAHAKELTEKYKEKFTVRKEPLF